LTENRSKNLEKILFTTAETGEETEFYIVCETKFRGKSYLLVTDSPEEEEEPADAYILKDISKESDTEAVYQMVDEDTEMEAVSTIFTELLSEDEIELETE